MLLLSSIKAVLGLLLSIRSLFSRTLEGGFPEGLKHECHCQNIYPLSLQLWASDMNRGSRMRWKKQTAVLVASSFDRKKNGTLQKNVVMSRELPCSYS